MTKLGAHMERDEFIDQDLIDAQGIELPKRESRKTDFKPWHRPHKQYIRETQWLRDASILVRDVCPEDDVVRYLTLPGEDLLDIRYLAHGLYVRHGTRLFFHGYDNRADAKNADFNSLEFSVKEAEYIDRDSRIVNDDIKKMGMAKAKVRKELNGMKPFHIINFDLCHSVANTNWFPGNPNYFDAIDAILRVQARAQWKSLLFVTSKIDAQSANSDALNKLFAIVDDMCKIYESFKTGFCSYWGIAAPWGTIKAGQYATEEERFLLGFVGWMIRTAFDIGLRPTLNSIKTYKTGYFRDGRPDDLASLSFLLEPFIPVRADRYGMQNACSGEVATSLDKEQVNKKLAFIPQKVKEREEVDKTLEGNHDLYQHSLEESQRLLGCCGYDEVRYRLWVEGEGSCQ